MSANAKKEMNELIRKLKGHGVECVQLPNGHWRTKTDPPLTFSFSPSDTNAARAAIRDVRKHLGIDIRQSTKLKKDSTNDFAMNRLRERTLKVLERGATVADLARLSVAESEDKRIGGWTTTNSAEVGISGVLKGNRLVKKNHDTLAAAVGKLEHADDHAFGKHLDKVAERFGKKRIAYNGPARVGEPETTPEPEAKPSPVSDPPPLPEPTRWIDPKLVPEEHENGALPAKVEVTVKIELGDETRRLIEALIGGVRVTA